MIVRISQALAQGLCTGNLSAPQCGASGLTEQNQSVGERGTWRDLEPLILVDEADREVGHLSKAHAMMAPGILHRAFSLLIFNADGRAAAAAAGGLEAPLAAVLVE